MEVLSENSMGNFTGPCESAKGGCTGLHDDESAKPLSSPRFLLSLTLDHDKIIPILTPHHSDDSRSYHIIPQPSKTHPSHQFPARHLTFTDHIGHNAIRRVVGCSTAITHQLVQVTRAESSRCFSESALDLMITKLRRRKTKDRDRLFLPKENLWPSGSESQVLPYFVVMIRSYLLVTPVIFAFQPTCTNLVYNSRPKGRLLESGEVSAAFGRSSY